MNVGWYYNWDWKSFKDMNFSNKKFDDLEFVPMIWGDSMTETSEIFDNVKSKGYKYLLAYNEPDLTWESNVRPDVMQYRWNDCVNNKGNVRLGSLAVSVFLHGQTIGGHHSGTQWQQTRRMLCHL